MVGNLTGSQEKLKRRKRVFNDNIEIREDSDHGHYVDGVAELSFANQ